MKPPIFMIALATAATLASTPALAEETTRIVRYDDLNLATPDGQARLQIRIHQAAQEVCTLPGYGDVRGNTVHQPCYEQAMKQVSVHVVRAVSQDRRGG